jgi:rhodanese-related sulfurtransferase
VLAIEAVEMLRKKGFKAIRLEEGIQDWRAMGLTLDVGD